MDSVADKIVEILVAGRFAVPDDIPDLVASCARAIGASDAAVYLVDYDQRLLAPVPRLSGPIREPAEIDATVAGRCFRLMELQDLVLDDGARRVWVPLLDGTERLGVLELDFDGPDPDVKIDELPVLAAAVSELITSKQSYGDAFELVRRTQPMSVAAELVWQLLPPLTFGNDQVVITAVVAPTYDLGGDAFDYGVDRDAASIAVFDAMGHGLEAGLLATVAVAATRNARRRGLDITGAVALIDDTVGRQFGTERFVTGVLADLDLATGRLRWALAGHPPPLLMRRGRLVRALSADVGLPFGLGGPPPELGEEMLEPGDQVLFFTDGVTEARSPEGDFFGEARLAELVARAAAGGSPPPETMRRLIHSILDHQDGRLQDDATIVLVEWRSGSAETMQA